MELPSTLLKVPFSLGGLLQTVFLYAVGCWVLYTVGLFAYRLTLHPLAHFPGPRLAGASYLYETWFEVARIGQYTNQIVKLHKQYGPIIRINPDELHCSDANFADVVYTVGKRKREKTSHFLSGFGPSVLPATFGTISHDQHRIRRAALNKFFTKSRIISAEPMFRKKSQQLCDKILAHGPKPFQMAAACSCFSTDTATEFCFGDNAGFLDQDGWEPNPAEPFSRLERTGHLARLAPWALHVMNWIPLSFAKYISSSWHAYLISIRPQVPPQMEEKLAIWGSEQGKDSPVYEAMRTSNIPAEEVTMERLSAESIALAFAGPAPLANTLLRITYSLLTNPSLSEKLRNELSAVILDPKELPSWAALSDLPYLSAVILEGLRLIHDPSRALFPFDTSQERLSRIAPDEDMVYEYREQSQQGASRAKEIKYVIPRGYAVGMSPYVVHSNESIFTNAAEFVPERWLDENGQRDQRLDRYLLSFAKGARFCVAMQLTYCILYIAVAALALRVLPSLKLCESEIPNVKRSPAEANDKRRGVHVRVVE